MRRHDIDFQILLEVGHVLSNIRKLPITSQASAPGAAVNCTEHDVLRRLHRRGKASGNDDGVEFNSIHDERFTNQTQAACLVQKNESRSAGVIDVNNQREFSNPSRGIATRALREALANVRVEHK